MMLERGGRVDGSDPQFATGRPCIIGFNWKDSCEKYLLVRNFGSGQVNTLFLGHWSVNNPSPYFGKKPN